MKLQAKLSSVLFRSLWNQLPYLLPIWELWDLNINMITKSLIGLNKWFQQKKGKCTSCWCFVLSSINMDHRHNRFILNVVFLGDGFLYTIHQVDLKQHPLVLFFGAAYWKKKYFFRKIVTFCYLTELTSPSQYVITEHSSVLHQEKTHKINIWVTRATHLTWFQSILK